MTQTAGARPTRGDCSIACSAVRGSRQTRERVIEAAEGNPLYIEQIVSMSLTGTSRGASAGRGGRAPEIVVPPTINALLAARLDHLTREERAVVEPASVIGLVFPELAVEDMVPTTLRSTVPAIFRHLDRKQFVPPLVGGPDPAFSVSITSSSATRPTRAS